MGSLDLDRCVALLLELKLAGMGFQFSFVSDVDKAVGSWVFHDVLVLIYSTLVHPGFTMRGVTSKRRYLIFCLLRIILGVHAQVSQREVTSLIRVRPWSAY